jgi:hypothetical protein
MPRPADELDFLIGNGGVHANDNLSHHIKMILHNDFLSACGDSLHIPEQQ